MRLKYNKTLQGKCYYIIRSVYRDAKNTSEIVEKLGYPEDIKRDQGCEDPYAWMQERLNLLNEQEKKKKAIKILVPFDPNRLIKEGRHQCFDIGYLFLQQIYYQLRLDLISKHISKNHAFSYDMNAILSSLVYGRILFPGSKLSTCRQSRTLLEPPKMEYHQVVRALSVIAREFDTIQSELYQNSTRVLPRQTGVLFYDCTNFYFETEEEDNITDEEADRNGIAARKYGYSKQHQPSPLVQMGLFMDYSGIPLAISINRGNRNEQTTLIPLEKQILHDFGLSRFIVCTDAGLASESNRMFNNLGERSFITTVSIKKMKEAQKEQCLEPTGWKLAGSNENTTYDLRLLEETEKDREKNAGQIFYKQFYIEGYDKRRDIEFNQTLFVTFSLRYRDFQRHKRDGQVQKALEAIEGGSSRTEKVNAQDYRRFINRKATDQKGGNVKIRYEINEEAVAEEARYDGFYAMETNLDDDVETIMKVAKGRWEIEESFRIMKDDFRSRPVYLSRNDRIKAHFMTCFISLLIYRILEKKLGNTYTCHEILSTLRSMKMTKIQKDGYIPSYTRTPITDALHEMAGFRTDYEITRIKAMKGILRKTKQR